jgi:hypothetical protein
MVFDVELDDRRGAGALRAINASALSRELVLVGADGRDLAIADPKSLYVAPTAKQSTAKFVSAEAVEAVIKNEPMPLVLRSVAEKPITKDDILARAFPQLYTLSQETGADFVDKSFDKILEDSMKTHNELGLKQQAAYMQKQVNVFKGLRTILEDAEDLLTPGSILPMQYLPDLFMAVPVWYLWAANARGNYSSDADWNNSQSALDWLRYMCGHFSTQRWSDTFLMYNRRVRTLSNYQGDFIPPRIIERMKAMASKFDYLAILTPYHDELSKDWSNLDWARSVDPYVVGFLKGVPMMFVLGRFSDSGVFPLHSELVADSIQFLRTNKDKVLGLNNTNITWPSASSQPWWPRATNKGTDLKRHIDKLLEAFDAGNLFNWLRGDDSSRLANA